ncbi:rhodanese [Leptospira bandrabouensis]|uniref:Rhodanese n=1 Tax=Leptospira bandrabouensis TaxID=2484903 RepID=A0A6H3NU12_9LEPT|nr:rhodanese [Leptospira bandrabouensis]MCG6145883.1 rhodanese [Leptospira bandrabouensis]MCG6153446.1 rhodanese [Leptospira bandrabouensis]MCG6165470.1 rhodanese [Leptospira bandrabouensis]TGN05986.1 rhodanese [Leptospira bandrabouensis]TGN16319.1 rhodanese [Leptospira bandrabouensis]
MKTNLFYKLIALITAGFIGACGGAKKNKDIENLLLAALALSSGIKVNTAAELAKESNENYNLNEYGLITPSTLGKWVNNWSGSKPSGINGKLVILQNGVNPRGTGGTGTQAGKEYIGGNGNDVVVYSFNFASGANALDGGDGFSQKRNNGLADTISIIADGAHIDKILNQYGIDPANDLVVLVSTADAANHVQGTLRAFYSFRYWGFDHKNLAFLNGTLPRLIDTDGNFVPFSSTTNTPPGYNNRYSVKSLRVDNTILMLPLEDVIKAVKAPNNVTIPGLTSSIFVSDARSSASAAEYNGTIKSTQSETAGKYVGFEGRIKGAKDVPWTGLLDTEHRFKSKADLKAYFDTRGYQVGQTAIQLCRTNNRSQVTGFSYIAILGYPSTYYDGSWIEWGSLTGGGPAPKLPPDSPFRTDIPELSEVITYNVAGDVDTSLPTNLNISATTTRKIIEEDKAYKR